MKTPELLAPGGDIDSIKAAIAAGADAIYCGVNKFNARNRARNLSLDELGGIIRLAHKNGCKIFLTLNIIIVETELPALVSVLNTIANIGLDGVIVQDFGLLYFLQHHFHNLPVHASTQLTTHNSGQLSFLRKLNVERVNLCRELNIKEITDLTSSAHAHKMLTEVFIHGSHCISFSGCCYMSSAINGNSGNRGRCSQPCRDPYQTTSEGVDHPLNLKDISVFQDSEKLINANVDSFKIEGRIKKSHYVYATVAAWRKKLSRSEEKDCVIQDSATLHTMFNRGFSNGFLCNNLHKNMFIDNARDNSAQHLAEQQEGEKSQQLEQAKETIYSARTEIIQEVNKKISLLKEDAQKVSISISGKIGQPLKVYVKTEDNLFDCISDSVLRENVSHEVKKKQTNYLEYDWLHKTFSTINTYGYQLAELHLDNLQNNLFLPVKELTTLKREVIVSLNGVRSFNKPIDLPRVARLRKENIRPSLSVLISSTVDIHLSNSDNVDFYYQLPENLHHKKTEIHEILESNPTITPWFPSILMEKDLLAGVELLQQVRPRKVVTNNTGIAFHAFTGKIPWIAGPYMNIANSVALECLHSVFGCAGAYLSNELNKMQIELIQKPQSFKLFYSMYHPLLLMTSRQCLFHQVSGCTKEKIDEQCLPTCEKTSVLKDLQNRKFFIDKEPNCYHRLYNGCNFLNTDIVTEIPDKFSSFLIDLRDIKTDTRTLLEKPALIALFVDLLNQKQGAKEKIEKLLFPVTDSNYTTGI